MSRLKSVFSAAVFLWLSAAVVFAAQVQLRGSVPGGVYPGFHPGWLPLMNGLLGPKGTMRMDAPDLKGSVLPSIAGLDVEDPAAQARLAPILYHVNRDLGYDLDGFGTLPAQEQRQALALAAEEASARLEEHAYTLTARKDVVIRGAEMQGRLPGYVDELDAVRSHYAPYISKVALDYVERVYDEARGRMRELRDAELLDSAEKTAAELAVTSGFQSDVSGWGADDWVRLDRDLEKVRALVARGEPLRGEQGNVKFLSGPLSGMGEIKTGARRTHRLYFRYLPDSGRIVLIRYAPREKSDTKVYPELQKYLDNAALEAAIAAPDPRNSELMRRIRPEDLDIRLDP